MFIQTVATDVATVGDIRRALAQFTDECPCDNIMISYRHDEVKGGKILILTTTPNKLLYRPPKLCIEKRENIADNNE